MEFTIGDKVRNMENGEWFITITLSNTDVKNIKSAIEFYPGDKDDLRNKEKIEKLRDNIHQTWRKLNPS